MTPPHAETWSQRGRTPLVRVRGCSRRRISIATLTCCKPGHRSRLIYRPRRDDDRRDGRKSFSWRAYRDLLTTAHHQLGGPIVPIWDNLNVHKAAELRQRAAARDWPTIHYLPPYAPDLNPVEGIWPLLRRGWLANVAYNTPEHLIQRIRHGLRHIQYRPGPHRRPPHQGRVGGGVRTGRCCRSVTGAAPDRRLLPRRFPHRPGIGDQGSRGVHGAAGGR